MELVRYDYHIGIGCIGTIFPVGIQGYTNIGTYTVNGKINIDYKPLFEGDYSYSMTLYDVYGNCYYTQNVTLSYDENGDLYFDPDELA